MNVAIVIPLCGMLPFTFGEGPGPIPFRVSDELPILRDRYSPPSEAGGFAGVLRAPGRG